MKAWELAITDKKNLDRNGGYISIHDKGSYCGRTLFIEDDNGGSVVIENEDIGKLYSFLKPPLAG